MMKKKLMKKGGARGKAKVKMMKKGGARGKAKVMKRKPVKRGGRRG